MLDNKTKTNIIRLRIVIIAERSQADDIFAPKGNDIEGA